MDWGKYFKTLIDWKKLPSYRLETRIDSIIGYYLPEIVSHYREVEIIGIIPEFPIRCLTVDNDYQKGQRSHKADFLLISKEKTNYLVEFKTDLNSCKKKQDDYYKATKDIKLGALIHGIRSIYKATKSKNKYNHLINKLKYLLLIDDNFNFIGTNEKIEIIYIQPSKNNEDDKEDGIHIINFNEISEWLKKKQDIDDFEKELCEALSEWGKEDK